MSKATSKAQPIKKLTTPLGGDYDLIITKDLVGVPFVINGVEPIKTQYGDAFILIGHPVSDKKKKDVRVLCGATVLVKRLQQFIEEEGVFPVQVTVAKPKGLKYFVFAE